MSNLSYHNSATQTAIHPNVSGVNDEDDGEPNILFRRREGMSFVPFV